MAENGGGSAGPCGEVLAFESNRRGFKSWLRGKKSAPSRASRRIYHFFLRFFTYRPHDRAATSGSHACPAACDSTPPG
jgi:hypothetical protein